MENSFDKLLELLADNYAKGKIDDDKYDEMKNQFENMREMYDDLQDRINMKPVDRFIKEYNKRNLNKCFDAMRAMMLLERQSFKSTFLICNCLKSPLHYEYTEDEFEFNKKLFIGGYNVLKKKDECNENRNILLEFYCMTEALYKNNREITRKYEKNKFCQLPLVRQLCMICCFIQNNTEMMNKEYEKRISENNCISFAESNISDLRVDIYKKQKISLSDNFEGMLEYFNQIIRYLYYYKNDELHSKKHDYSYDIDVYDNIDFKHIVYIGAQRFMNELVEERFRFSQWKAMKILNKDNQEVLILNADSQDQLKSRHIAILRREYIDNTSILSESLQVNAEKVDKYIKKMSLEVDLNNIELWRMNVQDYSKACALPTATINAYKNSIKPFYLTCKIKKVKVLDIIKGYEYLYVKSKVYIEKAKQEFVPKSTQTYRYYAPIIKIDTLADEFSSLSSMQRDYCKKILKFFILDDTTKKSETNIFVAPLIRVDDECVIICEALIKQINLSYFLELLFQRYKVDVSSVGKEFENKLINNLKNIPNMQVNTNKIEFMANDNRQVEFDFIGTLGDCLLIFEFKSVYTPYSDKQMHYAEKTIREGVAQVIRRTKIVQNENDWRILKSQANINLQEIPYSEDKIIRVVCTNIFDFTTLKINGVRITDESTLLKYFTNPYVGKINFQHKKNFGTEMKFSNYISLWKEKEPSPDELIRYLDLPITVKPYYDSLRSTYRLVPIFNNTQEGIFVEALEMYKNPYMDFNPDKKKKVGRNDKCPCGSGKKYKFCCGRNL